MKFKSSLLCLSALIIFSCGSPDDCSHDLCGEWTWQSSYGGFGGWTLTPESENYSHALNLSEDTYQLFQNDSLIFESEFELKTTSETQIGTLENTFIELSVNNEHLAYALNGDTLTLFEQCYDCFQHVYTRQN